LTTGSSEFGEPGASGDAGQSGDLELLRDRVASELADQGLEAGRFSELVPRKQGVADDPRKILIEDARGAPLAVLIQAPVAAPDIAKLGVDRAREAARVLGPKAGSAVLLPLCAGECQGRSYSVLPWQRRLATSRWGWRLQRLVVAPKVMAWLTSAVEASARPLPDELLPVRARQPLEELAADERFAADMRRDAEVALARLADGRWQPKTVVVHNDLWKGNILLPQGSGASGRAASAPPANGIYLIDWGGAALPGFPFYDFARVCSSMSLPLVWARRVAARHCRILDCEPVDGISSLLLAIADIGANLGCMPVERYLGAAGRVHRFLRSALPH